METSPDLPTDPLRVLRWDRLEEWRGRLPEILPELVNREVAEIVAKLEHEDIVGDDLSWLDEAVTSTRSRPVDSLYLAMNRLKESYAVLRAYHGCCPVDFASYEAHGILPLDARQLSRYAVDLFTELRPGIPRDVIENAARTMAEGEGRHGHCYFECNLAHLVGECGHYVLYGSEFLVGVAAKIESVNPRYACQHLLKLRGTPTVFVCDVPICEMREDDVAQLAGGLLESYFEAERFAQYSMRYRGFGFSLRKPLPPAQVVGRFSPGIVRDPIAKR